MVLGLVLADAAGTQQHPAPTVESAADGWQLTTRSQSLTWTDLTSAVLLVETDWNRTEPFYVRECSLRR